MRARTLNKLAPAPAKLLEVVSGLWEEVLARQDGDGWTIGEIRAHLWGAQEDHCKVITLIAHGDRHRLPTDMQRDKHNAMRLAERGALTIVEVAGWQCNIYGCAF